MKIVVIGGSGLIGSKVVTKLTEHGHEAVATSPETGVNTVTGQGLAAVLTGASVVIDVSNSPSFETAAVLEFFERSTTPGGGGDGVPPRPTSSMKTTAARPRDGCAERRQSRVGALTSASRAFYRVPRRTKQHAQ